MTLLFYPAYLIRDSCQYNITSAVKVAIDLSYMGNSETEHPHQLASYSNQDRMDQLIGYFRITYRSAQLCSDSPITSSSVLGSFMLLSPSSIISSYLTSLSSLQPLLSTTFRISSSVVGVVFSFYFSLYILESRCFSCALSLFPLYFY